jgi:hypothetical protein
VSGRPAGSLELAERSDHHPVGDVGRPRLVADGNTHVTTPQLETVITPSHAVLYSGYLSAAGWMGWQVLQQRRRGHHGLQAVPIGYGLGLVGAVIFGLGGLPDLPARR